MIYHTAITKSAIRACVVLASMALLVQLSGCATPKGETRLDKREHVQDITASSLARIYELEPGTRDMIAAAPGYAVFDAVQTQFLITSTGNGYGLVHNNRTGKEYYMSAVGLGAGFGAGIKSQRIIIVFEDEQVMNKFVFEGWVFGASGTATARAVNVEDEVQETAAFEEGMRVYSFTENGLMAGVSLRGSKVWLDEKLN